MHCCEQKRGCRGCCAQKRGCTQATTRHSLPGIRYQALAHIPHHPLDTGTHRVQGGLEGLGGEERAEGSEGGHVPTLGQRHLAAARARRCLDPRARARTRTHARTHARTHTHTHMHTHTNKSSRTARKRDTRETRDKRDARQERHERLSDGKPAHLQEYYTQARRHSGSTGQHQQPPCSICPIPTAAGHRTTPAVGLFQSASFKAPL